MANITKVQPFAWYWLKHGSLLVSRRGEAVPDDARPLYEHPPASEMYVAGDDIEPRDRMQLSPGYLNSFETVISALKSGSKQAQDTGHIAHGACLLHAAVELEAVLTERIAPQEAPPVEQTPAEAFAKWLDAGPKLAKAAGCYVGIKVSTAPAAEGSVE